MAGVSITAIAPPGEVERLLKRIEREQKKSAAANKENAALRVEARKLRHANFLLKNNLDRMHENTYVHRYDVLAEAVRVAREALSVEVNGLPEETSKTLEPWTGPWYMKKNGNQP